jgi:hypothetical protein
MTTHSSKAALGPQPAGSPVITSGPLAGALASHGSGQIAQAHVAGGSPVPGASGIDAPQHLSYQPPTEPQHAVTLPLQVPADHAGNSLYRGVGGAPAEVRLQQLNASAAASSLPMDARSAPQGAAGLGSHAWQAEFSPARLSPDHEPMTTPERGGAPVIHYDRDVPGQLQRPAGDVGAPGNQYSTRPPGEQPSAAGGYPHGRYGY